MEELNRDIAKRKTEWALPVTYNQRNLLIIKNLFLFLWNCGEHSIASHEILQMFRKQCFHLKYGNFPRVNPNFRSLITAQKPISKNADAGKANEEQNSSSVVLIIHNIVTNRNEKGVLEPRQYIYTLSPFQN